LVIATGPGGTEAVRRWIKRKVTEMTEGRRVRRGEKAGETAGYIASTKSAWSWRKHTMSWAYRPSKTRRTARRAGASASRSSCDPAPKGFRRSAVYSKDRILRAPSQMALPASLSSLRYFSILTCAALSFVSAGAFPQIPHTKFPKRILTVRTQEPRANKGSRIKGGTLNHGRFVKKEGVSMDSEEIRGRTERRKKGERLSKTKG